MISCNWQNILFMAHDLWLIQYLHNNSKKYVIGWKRRTTLSIYILQKITMELLCFIHLASKFDTLYFFLISSSPTCHILSIATWRERLGNLQEGKRGVGGEWERLMWLSYGHGRRKWNTFWAWLEPNVQVLFVFNTILICFKNLTLHKQRYWFP